MIFEDFFRVTPKRRKVNLKQRRGVLFSNPDLLKKTIFHIGNWLFLLAVGYAVYLYYPLSKAIIKYKLSEDKITEVVQPKISPAPVVTVTPAMDEYSISIPKILAQAKIVKDVSPYNREEYLKVLEGNVVAQAKDTAEPGSGVGSMTYIFAHSTAQGLDMLRKNAVFYLLGELKNNDDIFISQNGKMFNYKVYKQLVVDANQTEYLKFSEPDKEILILQTCWPIGTNWKRLLILAERV